MLAKARAELSQVDFRLGDLSDLPVETSSVDVVVCALALTHCEHLGPPVRELARVLRPGGHLILSDMPPLYSALGMTAFFGAEDGSAGYVRSYARTHSAYFAAFAAAGIEVQQCIEPLVGDADVVLMSGGMMNLALEAFTAALRGLPGALIWKLIRR